MRALVVYESMFGNTERVAKAIAAGLAESMEVVTTPVGQAPAAPGPEVDLIVAGGPTHALAMSRPNTRSEALTKGATQGEQQSGLREWVDGLPTGHHTERLATFDTRMASMRHLPGSAARGAARVARRHGYPSAARAESFYVDDVKGPLLEGETERATDWGRALARVAAPARL
ncbi:MAG: flavodoxin/nitric oxide synthase [Lapillicoccus sp.]